MKDRNVGVLIVEDHSIVRWAVRSYLEQHGMTVVGETVSAAEAVDLATLHEPDVVLMDLVLEDGNGIEATRAISRSGSAKVLAFSAYDSPDRVEAFLRAGGSGFISKTSDVKDLLTAINAVLDDRRWLSPQISAVTQRGSMRRKKKPALSSREQEVAVLIAKGLPSSQIAGRLFVSLNTIETHRYRIFKKLEMHSRTELVDYVLKHNLMGPRLTAES